MFLATQKIKLFNILDDMRVAFPKYADTLGSEFTDETQLVRKTAAVEVLDIQSASGIIVSRISSISVDTYNEVILPEGIDKSDYETNNVVLWSHDYGGSLPVGECIWLKPYPAKTPQDYRAATKYYLDKEFPAEVYDHQRQGRPIGYSVGFIPTKYVRNGDDDWGEVFENWRDRYAAYKGIKSKKNIPTPDLIYTKCKLLEYSVTPVGANPDAVAIYVEKGFIEQEEAERYTIQSTDTEGDDNDMPEMTDEQFEEFMKRVRGSDDLKKYMLELKAEADKEEEPPQEPAPPAEPEPEIDIEAEIHTAVSEAMKGLDLTLDLSVPEALAKFSMTDLIAEIQGKPKEQ